ncbi:MAG: TetR family transcriptional regulator [Alphaproteobacteria bacterium]|nr:TetR family transcriptional regulator [Alphaproteobacteria bacterium]
MKAGEVKKQVVQEPPPAAERVEKSADSRRRKIASALGRCIRTKGFSATTLTDIAIAAEMSPNLLRYYFETKEEILEYYYRLMSDRLMASILKIERATPEQWLAEFCAFSIGSGTDRAALSLLIETFAVAMHHEGLNKLKARYDNFMARIYREFFQWAGTANGMAAHDAAQLARTIELGIKLGAVFQKDFNARQAESVFLAEMRRLAGLAPVRRTNRQPFGV